MGLLRIQFLGNLQFIIRFERREFKLRLFRYYEIFQIHNIFFDDIGGEYHQMLIWCTDEELSLMRYNSHTFVDFTFRSTPAPFIQCLIVKVHDAGTQMFVPSV
ncbi:hypothetical protein HZS_6593 [Henneguya salminicola]|nr:hypothetical protein HZS_6593 [Henneguya salminicola]